VAHDPDLVERIRAVLARERGVSEKRMFGGVAFLINGNLAVAASGRGGILLRVDPAQSATLSAEPSAARAVMRGREMDGWLRISTDELADLELDRWINRGAAFARSLSPK
jgi:TfoX N-terminal domain